MGFGDNPLEITPHFPNWESRSVDTFYELWMPFNYRPNKVAKNLTAF